MLETSGVRVVDVLYRVSTRAQESQGDSIFNQRREVEEKWAEPRGIKVRRRIEVAESGKSALRLAGDGFRFQKRAEYTELIVEYQNMRPGQRPDAVVIDWSDRWSRNVLEYSGLIAAFRMLGIRLLAIGDGLDLTDQRNDLVAHVRAAIGQEQLRITQEKVKEARRSRRERGKWQGGAPPDGYRTHLPSCPGLVRRYRETPDGVRHEFSVRACDCDETRLYRNPAREQTIAEVWRMLASSPLSWSAMADDLTAAGHRRPNGTPFRWNDLHRIGENPHYAGVMVYGRWERDAHDGAIKRRKRLVDQDLARDTRSIVDPYVSEAVFWEIQTRRYGKQTRNLPRAKNGSASELTGILVCPTCGRLMSSLIGLSSKTNRNGKPRRSPRKTYVYMWCTAAQGKAPSCTNHHRVRVDAISAALLAEVQHVAVLSDEAIAAALRLRKAESSARSLEAERARLTTILTTAANARHGLTQLFASGALSQEEVEEELFRHRRDRTSAEDRLREIDRQLAAEHAKPDFEKARNVLAWLSKSWSSLTVVERAEALRLLITRASYLPTKTTRPEIIRIEEFGSAFVEHAAQQTVSERRSRRRSRG